MPANELTPDLAAFIEAQTSIFLATASANGQPYIQHPACPHPPGCQDTQSPRTALPGERDFAGRDYGTEAALIMVCLHASAFSEREK
jgi:hypothetical protein